MTAPAIASAEADRANRLREEARMHKKNASFERKKAREKMEELKRFVAKCQRNGIIVILEDPPPQSLRRQSGSQDSRRAA